MRLFDSRTVLEKCIDYIEENVNYVDFKSLATYDFSEALKKFGDDKLSDVLLKMARNNISLSHLDNIIELRKMFYDEAVFDNILSLYVREPKAFCIDKTLIIDKVYNAFSDKKIVVEYYKNIITNKNISYAMVGISKYIDLVNEYVVKARKYYVDDRALLSSFITLIDNEELSTAISKCAISSSYLEKLITDRLNEDRKACGIYEVDRATLLDLDDRLDKLDSTYSSLKTLLESADEVINLLKLQKEQINDELRETKIREIRELQAKANKILQSFNEAYMELLRKERKTLNQEKDEVLVTLDGELEKRKIEFLGLTSEILEDVKIEKAKLVTRTSSSIKQLDEYIQKNETISKIVDGAKRNSAFLDKVALVGVSSASGSAPAIIINQDEREVSEGVNFYLDSSIPFSKRFEKLLKKKEELAKQGEIFHQKFDDIVKIIMAGNTPYMYGPSGCGKTYMIEKQLADLFGVNVVTNGYILYEQDIIGYNNAGNGGYVPGNFYRCFKYGDFIFLDELDNGIPNATVVLNRFLSPNTDCYTFPDGIPLRRHPNFRIICAGNTKGEGRTVAHNTRQKLDESVLQRLTPVDVNYDNRIEEQILINHKDWFSFAVNFRKALEEIPTNSGEEVNIIGTFTTRDAEVIKEYLDDKVFTDEQIMMYEIIQTKSDDTLYRICSNMDNYSYDNGGEELFSLFKSLVRKRK